LSERLSWSSTWIDDQGRRVSVNDTQQALIDAIIGGLTAPMCTDDILQALNEIRDAIGASPSEDDMTTIINNVCCGGCGSGSCNGSGDTGVDQLPPPDYEEDLELPEPDEIPPPTPDYQSWKCSRSYWLHYTYRNESMQLSSLVETGQANYGAVVEALAPLAAEGNLGYTLLFFAYQWLITKAIEAFSSDSAATILSAVTSAQSDYVCALYNSDGVNNARARFRAVTDNLSLSWVSRYYLQLLEQSIDYEQWLYADDWQSIEIPVSWRNRDCSCSGTSGGVLPPLPESGEYILVPIKIGEWSDTPNNDSADVAFSEVYSRFSHVALDNTLNYHQTSVALDIDAIVSRALAASAHGMVFQFVAPIVGGVDNRVNLRLSTNTGGTVEFEAVESGAVVSFQGDEYANVQEFADYVDSFTLSQVYGNGELITGSPKSSFGSESYLFDLSYTFGVRVWVICKVA
jgi:hypothetical protein